MADLPRGNCPPNQIRSLACGSNVAPVAEDEAIGAIGADPVPAVIGEAETMVVTDVEMMDGGETIATIDRNPVESGEIAVTLVVVIGAGRIAVYVERTSSEEGSVAAGQLEETADKSGESIEGEVTSAVDRRAPAPIGDSEARRGDPPERTVVTLRSVTTGVAVTVDVIPETEASDERISTARNARCLRRYRFRRLAAAAPGPFRPTGP